MGKGLGTDAPATGIERIIPDMLMCQRSAGILQAIIWTADC